MTPGISSFLSVSLSLIYGFYSIFLPKVETRLIWGQDDSWICGSSSYLSTTSHNICRSHDTLLLPLTRYSPLDSHPWSFYSSTIPWLLCVTYNALVLVHTALSSRIIKANVWGKIGELSRLGNTVQLSATQSQQMGHTYDKFYQFPKSSSLSPPHFGGILL